MSHFSEAPVEKVEVSAYTIPTDAPEGDGTLQWDSTTINVCEVHAGGEIGLGFTYGHRATAVVAQQLGCNCLLDRSALDIPGCYASMLRQVRSDGSRGIASMAISALDIALWDLKAKLLHHSLLAHLVGASRIG